MSSNLNILIIPMREKYIYISMLGLYTFDLQDSLRNGTPVQKHVAD
jgi:hypothetical protein